VAKPTLRDMKPKIKTLPLRPKKGKGKKIRKPLGGSPKVTYG
jgi:hypothetical protein